MSFEGEWFKALGKLKLIVPADFPTSDTVTIIKAKLYDSMGIAYDRMRQSAEAKSYFGKAIRHYRQLNNLEAIANTFNMMASGYQVREDWDGMKKLAEYILTVADKFDAEGKNGMGIRFAGWRMMVQIHHQPTRPQNIHRLSRKNCGFYAPNQSSQFAKCGHGITDDETGYGEFIR